MFRKTNVAQPKTTVLATVFPRPFQAFLHAETSSGVLLLLCMVLALLLANSPWSSSYRELWEHHLVIGFVGGMRLDYPIHVWINDGLMAIFFLLVGLEIKRELLVGDLSQGRQAILPVVAACGGAVFPALIYTAFAWKTSAASGWGIPMATDIAFALGVLALLGKGIPPALKVFLAALAIVDDLIAVLTIALFYSGPIHWLALLTGGALLLVLLVCNVVGIRHSLVYALLGFVLWLAVFQSGVHASISGVLLAFAIPARSRIDATTFVQQSQTMLQAFEQGHAPGIGLVMDDQQQAAVRALETHVEAIQAPLQRIEHILHLPVSFVIIPLFVLANAGVSLSSSSLFLALLSPVSLGIIIGLLVGKQLGIVLFSWGAVKLKWATLPSGVTWRQIYGVGWLGGIGFTMSLFIADLAFAPSQSAFLDQAKHIINDRCSQDRCALLCRELAQILECLSRNTHARSSEQRAKKEAHRQRITKSECKDCSDNEGQDHSCSGRDKSSLPHLTHLLHIGFNACNKHEENHAKIAERIQQIPGMNPTQQRWSDQHPHKHMSCCIS
jgi:NhaA family Na+:H+ antiporter